MPWKEVDVQAVTKAGLTGPRKPNGRNEFNREPPPEASGIPAPESVYNHSEQK